jgi:hypothetical protein
VSERPILATYRLIFAPERPNRAGDPPRAARDPRSVALDRPVLTWNRLSFATAGVDGVASE